MMSARRATKAAALVRGCYGSGEALYNKEFSRRCGGFASVLTKKNGVMKLVHMGRNMQEILHARKNLTSVRRQ
ncbi:hypothetical protein ACO0LB_10595 [Undibacterium sp. SXout7W]|uniref:hypothetical protein n=1 Tax=Undibacterium sp. SXout7W TaxID=3413049 RepID=UPI003BF347C0